MTINALGPDQNGWNLADNIFKCICFDESYCILIQISLKIVLKGAIHIMSALIPVMAWHLPGDKPLPESMLTKISHAIWCHRVTMC